jgi:high-affinity K+ transport system ATPase subunit B
MNEDKERKRKLIEHPEELLITNVIFLAVYILAVIALRMKGVSLDKFQISCTLLFIACFVCKLTNLMLNY